MNGDVRSLLDRAVESLTRSIPLEVMRAFRFFFAAHIALQTLKLPWNYADASWVIGIQATMTAAALLTLHRRWYPLGLLPLALYKGYWVVEFFPMTGNHFYAELLVLLVLLVFPDRVVASEGEGKEPQVEGTPANLTLLTILAIYFYSGVHKIIHGMWLDGEFLTLSLFHDKGFGMWRTTRWLIEASAGMIGSDLGPLPLDRAEGFATQPFTFSAWIVGLMLLLSWTIVGTELGVPLLVVFKRTHQFAIWLMLVLQVGIGIYAWETEFMFGAIGGILLFFHHRPWRNYGLLLALHVAWAVFVVAADLRIWEL